MLSPIRYYYHNLKFRLRFVARDYPYPTLKQDGVQICPKFASEELLRLILTFYERQKNEAAHYFDDFSELIICNTHGPVKKEDDKTNAEFENITQVILEMAKIKDLGKSVSGKNISIFPFISILRSQSQPLSNAQQDGQNTPHCDVFYPSHKLFIYLNTVTEDNGAFHYLSGSHAFSFKNAVNYYKDTFRYYFRGGKNAIYPTDATLGMYKNNFQWVAAGGNPGDGVLFNVQGIHKRGEFKKDTERERLVLLIDFRQAEVPVQKFAANV